MEAKEFLEKDGSIWSKIEDLNLTKRALIEFAKAYHAEQSKQTGVIKIALTELEHARVFISSREKMASVGIVLYDEIIETLKSHLAEQK